MNTKILNRHQVIPGFILLGPYGNLTHAAVEMQDCGYITICPHTLEFDIPEGFNQAAAEVETLEKKLEAMSEEYCGQVKKVKERIASLLSIENNPSVQS